MCSQMLIYKNYSAHYVLANFNIFCSFYSVVLHRLHLMTFYFSSVYYDVAKRISGIQYVRITFMFL